MYGCRLSSIRKPCQEVKARAAVHSEPLQATPILRIQISHSEQALELLGPRYSVLLGLPVPSDSIVADACNTLTLIRQLNCRSQEDWAARMSQALPPQA